MSHDNSACLQGGVLAQAGAWRWIFCMPRICVRLPRLTGDPLDLNLPLIGLAFALVLVFLRVRTPPGTIKSKLSRLDVLYVHFIVDILHS